MSFEFSGYNQRSERFQQELEAPMEDVLGATAEQAIRESPLSSVFRLNKLMGAESSPARIDADAARQRIKDAGLDGRLSVPDNGIAEEALGILMDRKKEEVRRQDILSRAPAGLGSGAQQLGMALAASVIDPVNIGLAFVPVVGQARYMRYLAGARGVLGRTAVRAGVGAVEGAAGAAIVEPLIYAAKTQEQADYDFQDSLLNVAFGTVFGGGLHVVGGLASDAGKALSPAKAETRPRIEPTVKLEANTAAARVDDMLLPEREVAMRTAVSQAVTGKAVDVEPVMPKRQIDTPEFKQWFGESRIVDEAGVPLRVYHGTPWPEFDSFDMSMAGKNTRNAPENVALHFTDSTKAANYYADVGGPNGAVMPVYLTMKNPLITAEPVIGKPDIDAAKAAGHDGIIATNATKTGNEYVVFDPKQVKSASGNSGRFDPNSASLTDARAAAERQVSPESELTADVPAAEAAARQIDDAGKAPDPIAEHEAAIADQMAELKDVARVAGIDLTEELAEFDEMIATAESYGKAARAAVLCGLGH